MRAWCGVLVLVGIGACSTLPSEDEPGAAGEEADASTSTSSGDVGASSSGESSSSSSSSSSSGGRRGSSSSGASDAGPDASVVPRFVSIASGVQHSCAVLGSGRLACWGDVQADGPVADEDSDLPQLVLQAPAGPPLERIVAVGAGNGTTCAMQESPPRVLCWGNGGYGRTGSGTGSGSDVPVAVVGADLSAISDWQPGANAVAMGSQHGCAIRSGGRVACWGRTAYGMLGRDDSASTRAFAEDVVGPEGQGALDGVTQLALGTEFSCALRGDKKVYCWGNRFRGALGDDTNSGERYTPAPVRTESGVLENVTAISAGGSHACALGAGGGIWCWGKNGHKELGVFVGGVSPSAESKIARPVLASANGAALASMRSVSAGTNHTCAVDGTGKALCWGFNSTLQLGIGEPSSGDVAEPRRVLRTLDLQEPLTGVRAVAAGQYHSVALADDGGGYAWGDRALGQDLRESAVAVPIQFDALPLEQP